MISDLRRDIDKAVRAARGPLRPVAHRRDLALWPCRRGPCVRLVIAATSQRQSRCVSAFRSSTVYESPRLILTSGTMATAWRHLIMAARPASESVSYLPGPPFISQPIQGCFSAPRVSDRHPAVWPGSIAHHALCRPPTARSHTSRGAVSDGGWSSMSPSPRPTSRLLGTATGARQLAGTTSSRARAHGGCVSEEPAGRPNLPPAEPPCLHSRTLRITGGSVPIVPPNLPGLPRCTRERDPAPPWHLVGQQCCGDVTYPFRMSRTASPRDDASHDRDHYQNWVGEVRYGHQ